MIIKVSHNILLILLFSISIIGSAQNDTIVDNRPSRYLLWSYHEQDVIINGLSLGIYSSLNKQRNTTTNGIRLELIGSGALLMFRNQPYDLLPSKPVQPNGFFYERVNGISISPLGLIGNIDVNGIGITGVHSNQNRANGFFFSLYNLMARKMNGISIAMFENGFDSFNGVSVSGVFSRTHTGNGLQVCIFDNYARRFNGVQLGLWNITETGNLVQFGVVNYIKTNPRGLRIIPLINFQFGKRKELMDYTKDVLTETVDSTLYKSYNLELQSLINEQEDSLNKYLDILPKNLTQGTVFLDFRNKNSSKVSMIFTKIKEACLNENIQALTTFLLASNNMIGIIKDEYYSCLANILVQKQTFFCNVYQSVRNNEMKDLEKFLYTYGKCQ